MFLFIGTFLLSMGLIAVLHTYLFRRIPLAVSKFIVIAIGIGSLFTLTVHGIWLGLTVVILGLLWLSYYKPVKQIK